MARLSKLFTRTSQRRAFRAGVFMKKLLFFTAFAFAASLFSVQAQDAAAIMQQVRDKSKSSKMASQFQIVVTNKNGKSNEPMIINQYSKDDKKGRTRTIVEFMAPPSFKGTRFLTLDLGKGKTSQMIYLPSLGKSRRIASSEKGSSFMGTDFSYDDMSMMNREADDDVQSFVSQSENYNGSDCYVIQGVPKDKGYQYSKTVSWVDKSSLRIYKIEMYDRKGKLKKVMELSNYKQDSEGHDTPTLMKITTVDEGTSTTMNMVHISYTMDIPDGIFTQGYIETGRQ
jgi:outer membrane lipoprotein-sorting protein